MSVMTSPVAMRAFAFAQDVMRLRMELKGMKGPPVFTRFKKAWGYTGTKQAVYDAAYADLNAFREGRDTDIKSVAYRKLVDQFRTGG